MVACCFHVTAAAQRKLRMMQLARDKERHRQAEIQRARMDQVQSPAPFCSEVIMPAKRAHAYTLLLDSLHAMLMLVRRPLPNVSWSGGASGKRRAQRRWRRTAGRQLSRQKKLV